MKTRLLAPLVTAAMAGGLLVSVAGPATAAGPQAQAVPAASTTRATTSPVSLAGQTVTDANGNIGTLTSGATFTPTQFINQNGQLAVQGLVNGVAQYANGATQTITNELATSVISLPATTNTACKVLSLTLGPLHLDLLGLVVDLNQVNLNITAQPGPGNLLGNLLCSVAGLLDKGVGLQGVVNILNNLLGSLGGLGL